MKKFLLLTLFFFFKITLLAQFGAPHRISNDTETFNNPSILLPADMDNDGDIDLVGRSNTNGNIVWLENLDGQGSYSDPIIIKSLGLFGIKYISIADLDDNGTMDVLGINGMEIFWFKNTIQNTATFSDQIFLPSGFTQSGREIRIGDINGDGFSDIVIVASQLEIGWYESIDGKGNFQEYQILSSEGRYVLELGDFDNDGDLDMISAPYDNSNFSIAWYENIDGLGIFSAPNIIESLDYTPRDLKIADLDNDGDTDFVFAISTSSSHRFNLNWYENKFNQGGTWATHIIEDTVITGIPTIYDIDQDNDLDLISNNGRVIIYENIDGQGNFAIDGFAADFISNTLDHADINNDGIQDLIGAYNTSTVDQEYGLLFKGKANQQFDNPIDFIGDADRANEYEGFMMGKDIDGDGVLELIANHNSIGRIDWQKFNNTKLKFTNPKIIGRSGALDIDFADLDGDGDEDILAISILYALEKEVVWYERLDGENNFAPKKVVYSGSQSFKTIQAEDIDGDGDIDIFFSITGGFLNGINWFENLDGQGNFSDIIEVDPSHHYESLMEDLDGDGDQDILLIDSWPYQIHWLENTNGSFSNLTLLFDAIPLNKLRMKDVDNDGLKDILYLGNNGFVMLHKNLGGSANFDVAKTLHSGAISSMRSMHLRDGDLDGDLDMFIYEFGFPTGHIMYLENIGGQNIFASGVPILELPSAVTRISIEDYDGDKDMDLVAHEDGTETMYFFESFIDDPSLRGKVFLDENENGNLDTDELLLFPQSILVEPEALATFSNSSGDFYFALGNGNYDVTCFSLPGFNFTTPSTVQVEVSDDSDVNIFFGLTPITAEVSTIIEVTSAPTRCGFEVPFWIDFQNTGTVIGNLVVTLELDSLVSFVSAVPAPDSIVGNFVYWSFENLLPTHSEQVSLILQMPGVEHLGEYITIVAYSEITSLDGSLQDLATSAYRSQINCAVDPNDKLVLPNIAGNDNYTLFGDTLDYTVRFQNTGTDTAFTVRIEDYLDANLDYSTLKIIGASHPYEVTLDHTTGRMMFIFDNILLPDSSTNEIESHGYFRYEIQHLDGLPENTYIQNYAGIYFDFNPPILTNTTESILVSQYPMLVNLNHPSCHGEENGSINLLFDLPFYESFAWSNGQSTIGIDSLIAGEYQLIITLTNGDQIDSTFTIIEPPLLELTDAVLNDLSCFGANDGSIEVEALGGTPVYFFQWSNGVIELINDELPAGSYSLTVTDLSGCSAIDNYVITEPDELILNAETTSASCFNTANGSIEPFVQGGNPDYNYLWSNGSNQANQYQLLPGTYTLTVTDNIDCSKTIEVVIGSSPEIILDIDVTPEFEQTMNGSITVQSSGGLPPFFYAWDFDPNETGNTIENLSAGEYTVTITDANNCAQEATIIVDQMTDIATLENDLFFKLSPNPSKGNFNIDFDLKDKKIWQLNVSNSLGQVIKKINSPSNGSVKEQLSFNLISGVYNVTFIVEGQIAKSEIIIIQQE